ncbi:MAG: hypothetical protein ACOC9Z_08310 [Chloroflexota bacterium]
MSTMDAEKQETRDGVFVRQDYPTIMSGWVVRYRVANDAYNGEINASRDGWSILGRWPVMRDREAFLRTVEKAFLIYRGLNGRGAKKPLPEEAVERLVDRLADPAAEGNEA